MRIEICYNRIEERERIPFRFPEAASDSKRLRDASHSRYNLRGFLSEEGGFAERRIKYCSDESKKAMPAFLSITRKLHSEIFGKG